jgi:hypothetical protein
MTKNAPAAQDATLALQTVADASNEVGQTFSTREGTIFDDLALVGALIFGDAISATLVDEVELD